MATEFKIPELGENIRTIQVARVMVAVGDTIAVDQPVVELETDKATVEVPSSVAGKVSAIHVKAGDEITVGHTVLSVENDAAEEPAQAAPATESTVEAPAAPENLAARESAEAPAAPAESSSPSAPATGATMRGEFAVPELGENIKTIQVVKVLVKPGDTVAKDQPVVELETDKATVEVPSTVSGVVREVRAKAGDELQVGSVVFVYEGQAPAAAAKSRTSAPAQAPTAEAPKAAPASAPAAKPAGVTAPLPPPAGASIQRVPASPTVRRFAREIGVDVNQVSGTGAYGRVSIEDVKQLAKALIQGHTANAAAGPAVAAEALPPLPDFEKWGKVSREKMSGIRRATAEHMARSWAQIPHVTLFDTADITELDELRKRYAPRAEAAGGKLTMATMVIKVAAQALKTFPKFNASLDMASREIVFKQYVHIGVAVDTERGLMVPVIRDTDTKNMIQISVELTQLAEKARTGKVALADLEGGTFTITNLGRTCGTFFTPIINYPDVAILGVGRAMEEADPRTGKLRKKLPLSLSFDHRIIDGSEGVRFLAWVIEALGEPLVLSLEG
ncbi:MAG: 2-oxo acid dehydrogenase subunit E2 [Verrucomicrobia bacterium]|nr:2-oxo acid dehydrogenase subunit E2 [Verrucomicrobiota bacterium]